MPSAILAPRQPPQFLPRFSTVARRQRHYPVWWKCDLSFVLVQQQRQQTWQVWEVSRDENVACFGAETIAYPLRRIVRLQAASRGEFRERIAGAPERFSGLLCPQLAAVPHDGRLDASGCRITRKPLDGHPPGRRERTTDVDLRTDRFAVMDQVQLQTYLLFAYAFSPARILTVSRFSRGGSGQVVYGLNAHGGL